MNDHPPDPTPAQAREQLAATQTRPLGSVRERRIFALYTAVVGLAVGFFIAAVILAPGTWIVASAVYVVVLFGGAWWVIRTARTAPRWAGVMSALGGAATIVLALVGVRPWLNSAAQTAPNPWPLVLIGALVAAVPSLLAAVVIAARRT